MKKDWYTKRKESKYIIREYQYVILQSLLEAVMDRDVNADPDGDYFVRSLYFDSMNRMDFNEKEMGTLHRRKIRFRYYANQPESFKFETKEKINRHTVKQSIALDHESAVDFFSMDFSRLEAEKPRLYDHLQTFGYRPYLVVDYEREAFVSEMFNIRINFDKNIRGSKDPDQWLSNEPFMVPLTEPGDIILEVKHDGHIPEHVQEILSSVDLTPVSYSKFYLGGLI